MRKQSTTSTLFSQLRAGGYVWALIEKSRIRETLNLSTNAYSSIDTIIFFRFFGSTGGKIFFVFRVYIF